MVKDIKKTKTKSKKTMFDIILEKIGLKKERRGRSKKIKGFTLIELLAVIVILGLLMAIAIPSITKYINESRKKTVATTIGNYIGSLVNEVNDLTYSFTDPNTIYAVPIECISLERGGISPLGKWYQASNDYWAYVLVQYDDSGDSYTYGFTFKDSNGFGLYPISQDKLDEKGSQIKTGLDLSFPLNGKVSNITDIDKWEGFNVNEDTDLIVLESESEGKKGNIIDGTCTLLQKGNNYNIAEEEKLTRVQRLSNLIKWNNLSIKNNPTLTTTSEEANENGFYVSNATNDGTPTYYFRGNVENNNVRFANLDWKIIRINEDGTVRLILNDRIDGKNYKFNTVHNNYKYMYYSNSDTAESTLDNWYENNIVKTGYNSYVATGTFCEQAKAKEQSDWLSGSATTDVYTDYYPNFKCSTDGNGKGKLDLKVGLITYDEVIYAGGYNGKESNDYYLYNGRYSIWTMSPSGFSSGHAWMFYIYYPGHVYSNGVANSHGLRPVINLNSDVTAFGNGEKDTPYEIVYN